MRNIPTVPAILFSTITTALDNLGLSSERVVEKAGLPLWQYHEPGARVPGTHFFHLLGRCARTFGEETFGLRIARETPMTSLGFVGRRLGQCLTVREAIKTVTELVPQFQNTSTMSISEGDEEVWLLRKRVQVADSGYRQVEISTLSWMIDVVRQGAGPDWQPAKICLEAKSVSGLERLETFANTEVRFEQGMTGLAIPRSLLSRRISTSGSSTGATEVAEPAYEAPSAEFLASLRQILRSFPFFRTPKNRNHCRDYGRERAHPAKTPEGGGADVQESRRPDPLPGRRRSHKAAEISPCRGGARAGLRRSGALQPRLPPLGRRLPWRVPPPAAVSLKLRCPPASGPLGSPTDGSVAIDAWGHTCPSIESAREVCGVAIAEPTGNLVERRVRRFEQASGQVEANLIDELLVREVDAGEPAL